MVSSLVALGQRPKFLLLPFFLCHRFGIVRVFWRDVLNKPKVVIADDHPAALRQLARLLADEFNVVATADNGRLALDSIRKHRPDIVVLDLNMPGFNGLEVTRRLSESGPAPAILICSIETDPEMVEEARRAGALGYVFKIRMSQDLIMAVRAAARGNSFISAL
jgi:DNA-binding NarL/FixJ family response regulator